MASGNRQSIRIWEYIALTFRQQPANTKISAFAITNDYICKGKSIMVLKNRKKNKKKTEFQLQSPALLNNFKT